MPKTSWTDGPAEVEAIQEMVVGKVKKLHKRMLRGGDLYYSVDLLTKEALKTGIELAEGDS